MYIAFGTIVELFLKKPLNLVACHLSFRGMIDKKLKKTPSGYTMSQQRPFMTLKLGHYIEDKILTSLGHQRLGINYSQYLKLQ